jgi:hypothetical protein
MLYENQREPLFYQGKISPLAEKLRRRLFVSGHDFSRAAMNQK